jgi:hypothetical protein
MQEHRMPAQKSPAAQSHERGIYLAQRIKAVQGEVKELRDEKRNITQTLRATPGAKTPEARKLGQRRIYATHRMEEAKLELEKLKAERQALVAAKRG